MITIWGMAKWLDQGWKHSIDTSTTTAKYRKQSETLSGRCKRSIAFIPGAFLIALGLLVVFFPRFFLVAVAAVLIFCGVLLSCIAWKLLETKKRLTSLVKDLEGKIQVQNFEIRAGDFRAPEETQSKKIIYH